MRVPHTIPENTLKAYEPPEATLDLVGERGRRLRAEDWTWDDNMPPNLAEICVRFLVMEFTEQKRALERRYLEEDDYILLLEILPTSLSLDLVIPQIPDEIYWKRRCLDTWSSMNDTSKYGDSWKRMFCERYVRDLIENEEPGYTDWTEFGNTLQICNPFIKKLDITQMQPPRVMETVPQPPDLCSIEDFIPEHLDLSPVLTSLQNLEELDLQFGVRNIGMKFTFKCFKVNLKDIERLAKGLNKSYNLKILRISCSDIDDNKLIIILNSLVNNKNFEELEISHCKITDVGAKAVGSFICLVRSLKSLKLQNNFITSHGAQEMADVLAKKERAELENLDLKFNLIGEEGGKCIANAIKHSTTPNRLILAGCGMGEEAGMELVDMLRTNNFLVELDLTNNALGEKVGLMMAEALQNNQSLLKIDVRNCGFLEESELATHNNTFRNREKLRKKSKKRETKMQSTVQTSHASVFDSLIRL